MNFEQNIIIPPEVIVSQLVENPTAMCEFLQLLAESCDNTTLGKLQLARHDSKSEMIVYNSFLRRVADLAFDLKKSVDQSLKYDLTQAVQDVLDGASEEKVVLAPVDLDQLL
jgi:hypothetical protein